MSNNGRQGELLFAQLMQLQGYTVIDVSDNPEYWDKDIDFIITSPTTGDTKTFEVKWDTKIQSTGNLYLELEAIHSKGGKGWFEFCQADYLAYGDANQNFFYVIPMAELRKAAAKLPYREARCGQDSLGQLVAIKDILNIVSYIGGSGK